MRSGSALRHYDSVNHKERTLLAFFALLEDRGVELDFDYTDRFPVLDDRKPTRVIDAFLEIDRDALDHERRELLEQLQEVVSS